MPHTSKAKTPQTCRKTHTSIEEEYFCKRPISEYDKEGKYCIFHCKEKPVAVFVEAFKDELEAVNESDTKKK